MPNGRPVPPPTDGAGRAGHAPAAAPAARRGGNDGPPRTVQAHLDVVRLERLRLVDHLDVVAQISDLPAFGLSRLDVSIQRGVLGLLRIVFVGLPRLLLRLRELALLEQYLGLLKRGCRAKDRADLILFVGRRAAFADQLVVVLARFRAG